jgi:hypothetical protein
MALDTTQIQDLRSKYGISPVNALTKSSQQPKDTGTAKDFLQKAKEVAVGFGKGVGSSVQGLQDLGQRGLAAIDPTQTYDQVKETTGIKPLTNADFGAKTGYEKAGKTLEFVAEVLFPTGAATKGTKVATKAGEVVGASLDNISSKVASISDDLVEGGVKVKDKVIDAVIGLDDKTKTALKRTPKEIFNTFVEKGKNAMLDDRNQTPLEFVGESVAEGLKKAKSFISEIGQKKSDMIRIPEFFKGKGLTEFNNNLQSFLNNRSLIENDKTVVKQVVNQFKALGKEPTVKAVDKFIDFAQDLLYTGDKNLTVPLSDKTVGGLKRLVSNLNTSLKSQLSADYGKLNDEYGRVIQIIGELNSKLGIESGNAGSLVKRLFSPSDARTKELFEELGKLSGQDYFRDARLAKFVMDVLGDTRAANILQQIPTSPRGLLEKAVEKGIDLFRDPIKQAGKFIDKQK